MTWQPTTASFAWTSATQIVFIKCPALLCPCHACTVFLNVSVGIAFFFCRYPQLACASANDENYYYELLYLWVSSNNDLRCCSNFLLMLHKVSLYCSNAQSQ